MGQGDRASRCQGETGDGAAVQLWQGPVVIPSLRPSFHIGTGQSVVPLTGHSARSSGVDGVNKGLIVVNLNGEGRGAPIAS